MIWRLKEDTSRLGVLAWLREKKEGHGGKARERREEKVEEKDRTYSFASFPWHLGYGSANVAYIVECSCFFCEFYMDG